MPVEQTVAPVIPIKINPNIPEGIVKEVPKPIAEIKPSEDVEIKPAPATGPISYEYQGVPLEVARFFNVSLPNTDSKTLEQLRAVSDWTKQESAESTMGDRLQKLHGLESKLGQPSFTETKLFKAWQWIRMDMHISELRKRQSAYERTI